jgi:ABC-2 type transport system permease protein
MLRSVFLKTLRDRRRALFWWMVGLMGMTFITVGFWPTIEESGEELNRLVEDLPPALRNLAGGDLDLTSPAGYLSGRVFSFLAPILFLNFAIAFGARTLAGEEQKGTLELVLARPIPRWRLVAEKFAALIVATFLLGAVLWGSLVLGAVPVGLDIGAGPLAAATLMVVLLGLAFGALALLVGSLTGKRGLALGITTAVAVGTYLLDLYASVSEAVEPFRGLSPFHYYDAAVPLRNGVDPAHAAFLLVVTVFLGGFSLLAFERRDVGV